MCTIYIYKQDVFFIRSKKFLLAGFQKNIPTYMRKITKNVWI